MKKIARVAILVIAAGTGLAALTACGSNSDGNSASGSKGKTIALLLPETKTTRYEAFDKPLFEAKVKELCASCKVNYLNADQDASKQQQQAQSAITNGASVLVLDPVDGKAAAGVVKSAKSSKIPVIAYDRFIDGADYYLSFDNSKVGALQGTALVEATGGKGRILMLNGSPTDPNAADFKKGAHKVIDASGLKIVAEYDNPDWSADNAQKFTTSQLNNIDPADLAGVYAANDGQAGGVIAALRSADLKKLPPVTGQDADLAALQHIVAGSQYMTIYKSYFIEASKAAEVAVAIVNGDKVTGTTDFKGVKSFIFDPVVIKKDNVIQEGYFKAADICTADYAAACTAAGIS